MFRFEQVKVIGWIVGLVSFASLSNIALAESSPMRIYIGTYTRGASEGIYVADYDSETGKIGDIELAAKSDEPSFLAVHPNRKFLYAVGEVAKFGGESTGFVSAFKINPQSGKLDLLNSIKSDGVAPCHLSLDHQGTTLLVANYVGGNVAAIEILADGRLGQMKASHQHQGSSVNARRQEAPHAHSINLDPANRFAFAADLGTDQVVVYRFDAESDARLMKTEGLSVSVKPGSGPRHFAFHPTGQYAYVINELLSTINVFHYDADQGRLKDVQVTSTLPQDFEGRSNTAEIVVHPTGRFVYGSNRGHDSIAVFSVDAATGKLTQLQVEPTGGKTPRNFVVDPSGKFLLAENQSSDTVHVFAIDQSTGKLTATGHSVSVPSPVCIRFWVP